MIVFPVAILAGFVVAVIGSTLTLLFSPLAGALPAAAPSSKTTRFCTHLFYWFAGLFLSKLLLFSETIPWPFVFGGALVGTVLSFRLIKPAAPKPAAETHPRIHRWTRFSNAFFWWFVIGFLFTLFIASQTMSG